MEEKNELNQNESIGFNPTYEPSNNQDNPSSPDINANLPNNGINQEEVKPETNTNVYEQTDQQNYSEATPRENTQENAPNPNPEPVYEEAAPQYVEVPANPKMPPRTDSYFDGKLLDYIGWSILRVLITVITLGFGGPWGECMLLNYTLSHTVLNGKRLKFEGTGGSLFVEQFKWIFLTIITLGIYGFWVSIKKTRWVLSNIHFEEEQHITGESYFDGKLLGLIGVNLLCSFLNIFTLFILYPFTRVYKLKWLARHSVINRKKIVFSGKALSLFGHYMLWFFLTIITLGIYGLWLNIKLTQWEVKNTHLKVVGEEEKSDNLFIILISIFILIVVPILIYIISSNPAINPNAASISISLFDTFLH